MYRPRLWFLVALLVYSVAMRLLPYVLYQFGVSIDPETTAYPWNFSPLYAICLFGGACFADRRWAFAIPLAAFVAGDLGIWALTGKVEWAFYAEQPFVYAAILLTVAMGFVLRNRRSALRIAATGLAATIMFFLVTNFGVWLLGTRYSKDVYGLVECYTMAIPFFHYSVISMAVFSAILFSPIALAKLEEAETETEVVAPAA